MMDRVQHASKEKDVYKNVFFVMVTFCNIELLRILIFIEDKFVVCF